jgi:hypothetical protein
VFEKRALRGIVRTRREEVTGDWRKLHNEELHNLCCPPDIIRVIKSWRMSWVGHVIQWIRYMRNANSLVENPKARDHLRDYVN